MKTILSILIFIASTVCFAQSPITLSNSNMPGNNDTLRYSNASFTSVGNYTQTGTNFNWNFSSLVSTSQGRRDYKNSFSTPYGFFFLGLNEYGEKVADTLGAGPLTITNFYNYYKKQTTPVNAYVVDGSGITLSSVPVPSYFSDKDELYLFPFSYPENDSTTFKFSTPTTTLLPIVYSKTGYRTTKCDGWGSITTPYGTANCLRVVTTQYAKYTIKNSFISFPVGFNNYVRSYQWLTLNSKIPYLEITGNLVGNNFTITQVRYRDNYIASNANGINPISDISGLELYPNPVNDKLYLQLKKINAYEVYDLNGKLLLNGKGGIENFIDCSRFNQGLYVLKLDYQGRDYYYKFIKN